MTERPYPRQPDDLTLTFSTQLDEHTYQTTVPSNSIHQLENPLFMGVEGGEGMEGGDEGEGMEGWDEGDGGAAGQSAEGEQVEDVMGSSPTLMGSSTNLLAPAELPPDEVEDKTAHQVEGVTSARDQAQGQWQGVTMGVTQEDQGQEEMQCPPHENSRFTYGPRDMPEDRKMSNGQRNSSNAVGLKKPPAAGKSRWR